MIYLVLIFLFLLFSVLFDYKNLQLPSNLFWGGSFLILVFLMSFRYKLGGDTFNYMRDFASFPYFSELTIESFSGLKYAPLWIISFSFLKSIVNSFVFFQFVHAVFINGVIFWFINKYSRYRFSCVLFYFLYYYLYFNTEILRESVAICLFLLAVPSFLNNNWKRYYLIAVIAVLFHYSASILLLFPLLKNLRTNWLYYVISIIVLYVLSQIVLSFLPPIFSEIYNLYVVFEPNLGGYIYTTFCFILFPAAVLYIQRTYIDPKYIFHSFVFVFFLISVYTYFSPSIALRFFNYLIPLASIVFINLFGDLFEKKIAASLLMALFIPLILLFKSQEYFKDTSGVMVGTKFHLRWYPYTHVFAIDNKKQFEVVEKREKWVDLFFNNLVDDVKELSF